MLSFVYVGWSECSGLGKVEKASRSDAILEVLASTGEVELAEFVQNKHYSNYCKLFEGYKNQ
jgi:hypothetical protein